MLILLARLGHAQEESPTETELANASWVEGHVVVPRRTPNSEVVTITAQGEPFGSGAIHEVRIEDDGSFRVAFSPEATSGELVFRGHYLYLKPRRVNPQSPGGPLKLRPKLGGRVTGILVPPAGFVASDLAGTRVELVGWLGDSMSVSFEHSAIVGSDLTFAFDALSAPAEIDLISEWNDRPLVTRDALALRRGKNRHVRIQMVAGAQIVGTVVDIGGSPLEGVSVWRGGEGASGLRASRLVRTDSTGAFELTKLDPGAQTISAQIRGLLHSSVEVSLADGERLENVELILRPGGKLEGVLLTEAGEPQANLWIGLELVEVGQGSHSKCVMRGTLSFESKAGVQQFEHRYTVAATTTNAAGRFTFETLPAGPMKLWASANLEGKSGRVLLRDAVEASNELVRIQHERIIGGTKSEPARTEKATISGRVLGPDSKPLRNVQVTVLPLAPSKFSFRLNSVGVAMTDKAGRYSLQTSRRGAVEVDVVSEGLVRDKKLARVEAGSKSTLNFALQNGGSIQGTAMREDGQPAARYWVYASQSTGEEFHEKRVNPRGGFSFHGLASGYWSLELYRNDDDELIATGYALVEQGKKSKIELLAARMPVDVFGVISVGGRPFESASVTFQALGHDEFQSVEIEAVDHDGWYRARLPGAGVYDLTIERGGFFMTTSRKIAAGPENQIDVELRTGKVSGRLVTSFGESVANAPVQAESVISLEHEGRFAIIDVESDEQGYFQFENLPIGVYRIAAGPNTEFTEWSHPALGDAGASEVEVLANQSISGVRLELPVAARIEGVVLDESGTGVTGAEVYGRLDGALLTDEPLSTTDKQGNFTISQLAQNVELFATTRHRRSPAVIVRSKSKLELRLEPATLLRLFALDESGVDSYADYRILDEAGRESPPRYNLDLKLGQDEYAFGPLLPGNYTVLGIGSAGTRVSQDCSILDEVELKVTVTFPPAK